MSHAAGETSTAGYGIKARGPNPQFFGAGSQISAVDGDWPVFKKSANELTYHQILQPGANAGLFFPSNLDDARPVGAYFGLRMDRDLVGDVGRVT